MLAQPIQSTTRTASASVDLDAPSLYLNSETSWLQFNWRVLEEALDARHPLLERVKFLAIFAKNLDEFFMIRVSGLLRQVTEGVLEVPPDGLRPSEQLTAIRHMVMTHRARYAECWQPEAIRAVLMQHLHLAPYQVYTVDGPLGMASVMELTRLDRPDLKDLLFLPGLPGPLAHKTTNLFGLIRRHDLLLYHPYDSFMPVVDFVRAAAHDPHVLAIKQTLYRVGANSPVVEALMEAREHRKQVTAVIELQARFDEEHNITWSRALEQVGVHVIYGVMGLKTHAKVCLVIRREPDGMHCYMHMSTGNYNTVTGHLYTDLSYFTCDPAMGADIVDLFNALTGYARQDTYRKLLVAPRSMRSQLLARIAREIERQRQHGDGYLAFKMNALGDKGCIQALYRASQAGVKIDLQVRGICCLRPGVPGVSEHMTVTSIVGQFLEHTRIYYFRNGGQDEVLLGSADLMPRNLDRRVEILFPVEEPCLRQTIIHDILSLHLQDNVQARRLG